MLFKEKTINIFIKVFWLLPLSIHVNYAYMGPSTLSLFSPSRLIILFI